MLPISNLGCIIIDEEHDIGFQEKKHPHINTKEAALLRAQLLGIPIVLGSATPSISSLYQVAENGWQLFKIQQRFAGAFPQVTLVHLHQERKRREFWISPQLEAGIRQRLANKEQIILFLNRRGYSFFVQCTACTTVFSCKNCSVSLTYHDTHKLVGHYCDFQCAMPPACFSCKAPDSKFLKKGLGTQQVAALVQKLFPQARIGRADADSTRNKKKWQQTMTDFAQGDIDILVGTQTLTKGYHFPRVTLVGVIWAELNLNIPFYNAAETTLQQLIQVAGRAGRASDTSEVIIQTMSDHKLFEYLSEVRYREFYEYEIVYRKQLGYPPCMRFAEIELSNADEQALITEARACADIMRQEADSKQLVVTILGPASPPVYKIKQLHMRRIYIKSAQMHSCAALYAAICRHAFSSSILYTPNPLS